MDPVAEVEAFVTGVRPAAAPAADRVLATVLGTARQVSRLPEMRTFSALILVLVGMAVSACTIVERRRGEVVRPAPAVVVRP